MRNKLSVVLFLLVLFGIALTACTEKQLTGLNEWEIIKEYVLTNYPISEDYFDSHFQFASVEYGRNIYGDYDYEKKRNSILISDITIVYYTFTITDKDGQTHSFTDEVIYMKEGKVIDSETHPQELTEQLSDELSDYERSALLSKSYDRIAPTRELEITVTKEEAIILADDNDTDCKGYFNLEKAEQSTELKFVHGKVFWDVDSSPCYCSINAESGIIDCDIFKED